MLLASIAVQGLRVLQAYCLGVALGIATPLWVYFVFIPLIVIVMQVPITVSGLGVSQAMFELLFTRVGVPSAEARRALDPLHRAWRSSATCRVRCSTPPARARRDERPRSRGAAADRSRWRRPLDLGRRRRRCSTLCCSLAAVAPGLPLGIARCFGRRHPGAWIGGALLGYGLTQLALWAVIAAGDGVRRRRSSLAWLTLVRADVRLIARAGPSRTGDPTRRRGRRRTSARCCWSCCSCRC